MRWWGAVVAALSLGVVAWAPAPVGAAGVASGSVPQVTMTVLRGPDGAPLREAVAVNDRGQVAGMLAGQGGGGALWSRGRARPLAPPGGNGTPLDLSEAGHVVGGSIATGLTTVPFSWSAGRWRTLPVDGGVGDAVAVNGRGQVLGSRQGCAPSDFECLFNALRPYEAWVWDGDQVARMPSPGPGEQVRAVDINDRGQALVQIHPWGAGPRRWVAAVWQVGGGVDELAGPAGARVEAVAINRRGDVAGEVSTDDGDVRATVWRRGRMIDLGTLGGPVSRVGDGSYARTRQQAFSDRGHVVGSSTTASGDEHAFLWQDGEMVDLGTLGGTTSAATAVNDRGQVVGHSTTATGEQHAFLWHEGRMIDLGRTLAEGSTAVDINDRGQIVGHTTSTGDTPRALLWTVTVPDD